MWLSKFARKGMYFSANNWLRGKGLGDNEVNYEHVERLMCLR